MNRDHLQDLWAALQEVGGSLDPLMAAHPGPLPSWMSQLDEVLDKAIAGVEEALNDE